MKTYCELYFEGNASQLEEFVEQIGDYVSGEWEKEEKTERWKEYLFIDYIGTTVDKARVTIHLGDDLRKGRLKVVNIIPLIKKELSIDEYNAVLKKFNSEVIERYRRSNPPIQISQISSEVFNPLRVITEKALCDSKLDAKRQHISVS